MQRNTLQRQIILDALTKLKTHPAVEEVYAEIQHDYPSISKTTVYRNLRLLTQNGVIREVSLPDGFERYDSRTDLHYHFKCRNCGRIFDIDMEYLAGINKAVEEKYDFQVDTYDIVFKGVCAECRKKRPKV